MNQRDYKFVSAFESNDSGCAGTFHDCAKWTTNIAGNVGFGGSSQQEIPMWEQKCDGGPTREPLLLCCITRKNGWREIGGLLRLLLPCLLNGEAPVWCISVCAHAYPQSASHRVVVGRGHVCPRCHRHADRKAWTMPCVALGLYTACPLLPHSHAHACSHVYRQAYPQANGRVTMFTPASAPAALREYRDPRNR